MKLEEARRPSFFSKEEARAIIFQDALRLAGGTMKNIRAANVAAKAAAAAPAKELPAWPRQTIAPTFDDTVSEDREFDPLANPDED